MCVPPGPVRSTAFSRVNHRDVSLSLAGAGPSDDMLPVGDMLLFLLLILGHPET